MIEKDDWRLLNMVEYLKDAYMNPTDGEELYTHSVHLRQCRFCLEPVNNSRHQYWYIPLDLSCCICEKCFRDFQEEFEWKVLDGWDICWDIRDKSDR